MKWMFIGLLALIGVLDVMLVMGSAKLEKEREEIERKESE